MAAASFSCSCGQVKGSVAQTPARGLHLECYCDSCRAGALYSGAQLPSGTPLDLYLTQPEHVEITQGLENLTPFVFSPKGIVRWKARCCNVPMFSSRPSPKSAFISVVTDRFETPGVAGPVKSKAFVPKEGGKVGHSGILPLAGLLLRVLGARLNGTWRKTPLYDVQTLRPIVEPTLVSKEEKAALLATTP
ncbi:MAG: DUF6151 family protein [Sulfitobacter sp.]